MLCVPMLYALIVCCPLLSCASEKRAELNRVLDQARERQRAAGIKLGYSEGQAALDAAVAEAGFDKGRSTFRPYDVDLLKQLPEHVRDR